MQKSYRRLLYPQMTQTVGLEESPEVMLFNPVTALSFDMLSSKKVQTADILLCSRPFLYWHGNCPRELMIPKQQICKMM